MCFIDDTAFSTRMVVDSNIMDASWNFTGSIHDEKLWQFSQKPTPIDNGSIIGIGR